MLAIHTGLNLETLSFVLMCKKVHFDSIKRVSVFRHFFLSNNRNHELFLAFLISIYMCFDIIVIRKGSLISKSSYLNVATSGVP